MPIDPQLVLGARAPQIDFKQPDPLDTFTKSMTLKALMGQNDLQGIKIKEAEKSFADEATASEVSKKYGSNVEKIVPELFSAGLYKQGLAARKALTEEELARTSIDKNKSEILAKNNQMIGGALIAAHIDPSDEHIGQLVADLAGQGLKMDPLRQQFANTPDPEARRRIIQSYAFRTPEGLAALKAIQPHIDWQDTNAQRLPIQINSLAPGYGAQVPGVPPIDKVQSPDSVAADKRSKLEREQRDRHFQQGFNGVGLDTPEGNQQLEYWAEVMRRGGTLPPGLARGPGGSAFVREVTRRAAAGDTSPAEMMANQAGFAGEKAGQRTLGTRTANIEMAGTEAANLAPVAIAASEKVDRTQYPTLNRLVLAAERGTGDENVTRLAVATNSLVNAYARAISPSGVGTVSDKDHARAILDDAYSKGQYKSAVGMMLQEIEQARRSPGQVKEGMRGRFTGQEAPPSAATTAAPAAPRVEKVLNSLPDPAQYRGKRMETEGTVYRSDGARWVREAQ